MISERTCVSHDIPPQRKILNMVIPILMHLELLLQSRLKFERWKPHKTARHPTKLMTSNYFQDILKLLQIFDVIQYN